ISACFATTWRSSPLRWAEGNAERRESYSEDRTARRGKRTGRESWMAGWRKRLGRPDGASRTGPEGQEEAGADRRPRRTAEMADERKANGMKTEQLVKKEVSHAAGAAEDAQPLPNGTEDRERETERSQSGGSD